jgi:hypothetical protein
MRQQLLRDQVQPGGHRLAVHQVGVGGLQLEPGARGACEPRLHARGQRAQRLGGRVVQDLVARAAARWLLQLEEATGARQQHPVDLLPVVQPGGALQVQRRDAAHDALASGQRIEHYWPSKVFLPRFRLEGSMPPAPVRNVPHVAGHRATGQRRGGVGRDGGIAVRGGRGLLRRRRRLRRGDVGLGRLGRHHRRHRHAADGSHAHHGDSARRNGSGHFSLL